MKKKILFLLSFVLILGFTACENNDNFVPENPNRSFIVTLTPNKWVKTITVDGRQTVTYDIPLRDLTDYYVDQGLVHVALSFDQEGSYDVLPMNVDGLAYSINYTTGWITVTIQDPIDEPDIIVGAPTGNVIAKIILSKTDYFDYQGIFNNPSSEFEFKSLDEVKK